MFDERDYDAIVRACNLIMHLPEEYFNASIVADLMRLKKKIKKIDKAENYFKIKEVKMDRHNEVLDVTFDTSDFTDYIDKLTRDILLGYYD